MPSKHAEQENYPNTMEACPYQSRVSRKLLGSSNWKEISSYFQKLQYLTPLFVQGNEKNFNL